MRFTDIFIQRPVLATVVSLVILLLGGKALMDLNVRQYPELQNAVVSVNTTYVGADAELVQGFITTPLEREIASAQGIDYIRSTSIAGVSSIQAYLRLDYDPNVALTQIAAKVNKLRNQLPEASEDPVVALAVGDSVAAMYLSFFSGVLDNNQITDYLVRVVEPKLATVPGVQRVQIIGDRTFAMRIWLKPDRMAALGVTASDVYQALRQNNVLAALGSTKGTMMQIDLTASTDISSPEQFRAMTVRADGESIVRLGEVADVQLGSENYSTAVSFNGKNATFLGIEVAPDANALDVIREVRERAWPEIIAQLPEGLEADIPYDSTEYINDSIDEVVKTLIEAVLIVIVVIYLFLGSARSVIIPAVTVPLSIIGSCFLMLLMGFSINLLTLLSMVLAIGMVVDDAIIVLENIHRHIEDGMKPVDAAIKGARELLSPVIAMTITLVAVYLPIGFLGGITGTLFVEFAFSLAGAVLLSGVIAMTLSPMMCAKLLKEPSQDGSNKLAHWLDARFESLRLRYQRGLHSALNDQPVILTFALIVLVSCFFLFKSSPREMAPAEDQGFFMVFSQSDAYSSLDYLVRYTHELGRIIEQIPEKQNAFLLNGVGGGGSAVGSNTAITGVVLKPWSERERSTKEVQEEATQSVGQIAGLRNAVFAPPPLPSGGGGFPVEFVITGTQSAEAMQELGDAILAKAMASKKFIFMQSDLKIDKPQVEVVVDREKAALLGIPMQNLVADMSAMLSGGYANRFSMDARSYKVIPQVDRRERLTPEQLGQYYTRTEKGELIPLSTVISLRDAVQPQALNRFQQLNAITLSGVQRPGVTLGEALTTLQQAAAEVLPAGYGVDYAGESRQYQTEGSALVMTFFFALTIIYLVLAAQFESFRDPLIILVTVPMSICGALLCLNIAGMFQVAGATLNIYTQVGLVTLIGVISKHGILIVEFANQLQRRGYEKRLAIEEAASIRLRPVLMTTAALVLAMLPLLIASGPGAAARFSMGLVIAAGMTIGTLFTLYVVPSMYLLLGRDLRADAPEALPAAEEAAS